ncbi:hypothetical protein MUK42_37143 [Musa troglodytarum]|uniref:Uncharacterized protein n=1 Tax=Musa troglodytarum TaxID=320322 RepID=A0A9E7GE08_9LILI|nr:hypothetical protein MUK42_37143 [Musa troglodytarum]
MLIHVASRAGRVEKGREASRAERANGLLAIRFDATESDAVTSSPEKVREALLRRRRSRERVGTGRKKGFADRFTVTLTRNGWTPLDINAGDVGKQDGDENKSL